MLRKQRFVSFEAMNDPLPYKDTKPVGAADFYFAINATFRFIHDRFGMEGLRRYWTEMGANYFAPVSASWKANGLDGVMEYWKAFFAAEPKAEVDISRQGESVVFEVKTCPAIKHLRDHQRQVLPSFCQHCYFVSEAMAYPGGMTVRIDGGNGSCRQTFLRATANLPPQDLGKIKEAR